MVIINVSVTKGFLSLKSALTALKFESCRRPSCGRTRARTAGWRTCRWKRASHCRQTLPPAWSPPPAARAWQPLQRDQWSRSPATAPSSVLPPPPPPAAHCNRRSNAGEMREREREKAERGKASVICTVCAVLLARYCCCCPATAATPLYRIGSGVQ